MELIGTLFVAYIVIGFIINLLVGKKIIPQTLLRFKQYSKICSVGEAVNTVGFQSTIHRFESDTE